MHWSEYRILHSLSTKILLLLWQYSLISPFLVGSHRMVHSIENANGCYHAKLQITVLQLHTVCSIRNPLLVIKVQVWALLFVNPKMLEYLAKFNKDTANCPDVHFWTILRITNQKFRSSVPSCGYIVREVITRSWNWEFWFKMQQDDIDIDFRICNLIKEVVGLVKKQGRTFFGAVLTKRKKNIFWKTFQTQTVTQMLIKLCVCNVQLLCDLFLKMPKIHPT